MDAHKDRRAPGGAGFYFGPRPAEPVSDQVNELINAALVDETARQEPRGYLGGSRLGLACHRQLAYEYFQTRENVAAWNHYIENRHVPFDPEHRTPHPFKGKTLRRFRMGHWHEDETAAWLRLAGFDLRTHKPDGGQYGFKTAIDKETGDPRMAGHIDGVIIDGPIVLPYPLLWEHKIMKHSKWLECKNDGVKSANPVYYFQMQTYMAYMELKYALFMAADTDTSELLVEQVPLVAADAQWATDRGVAVLQAQSPEELPRIARESTSYLCRWCDFKERCWAEPEKAAVARPAWLEVVT